MSKKILISGIAGQDGSYLADLLLEKKYEVYGIVRKNTQDRLSNIKHTIDNIKLYEGDITDQTFINTTIKDIQPDELYHLASQSFVAKSFVNPYMTLHSNIFGTLNILESIRKLSDKTKLYFAGSSEMFGKVQESPQTEKTAFYPRSPYGVSKATGFDLCRNYRESYGLFISNGILFNHESERRGIEFVTKKITDTVARIKYNGAHAPKATELVLGNIDTKRDWGYAENYVEAMWLMLQQDKPDDYVIATGETHSVREFVIEAFNYVGLDYTKYLIQDAKFMRPAEVDFLVGDASKAKKFLGWEPKVKFKDLVKIMMEYDCKKYRGF